MKRSIVWSRPSARGAHASRPYVPFAAAVAALSLMKDRRVVPCAGSVTVVMAATGQPPLWSLDRFQLSVG